VEPLCRLLLENVYILRDPKQGEDGPLPYPEAIVLHPEGKFNKHHAGLAGGSVGLFEGKRIGRAKNLENLAREIKIGGELIDKLETELTDGAQQVAAWKESSQKELLGELDTQRNRV